MIETLFHHRRAVRIENDLIRVTLTVEGGHIAEIVEKSNGVNPLWVPPWRSMEISDWSAEKYPEYGNDAESRLLSGIMGHNLCLDLFGPPSETEAAAGLPVHGEAGVLPWQFAPADKGLRASCILPAAQLRVERTITLEGHRALIHETVENLSICDRPIAWTEHVTLGPPFLERGVTRFRASTDPRLADTYTSEASSSGYSAHAMSPDSERAWFCAWSPSSRALLGYVWMRNDFPWLGIWEENHARAYAPWNGRTMTRGMEFGVSPVPEPRRKMIERGSYGWAPAKSKVSATYYAAIATAPEMPEDLTAFERLLA
jgi:hypothetical protein